MGAKTAFRGSAYLWGTRRNEWRRLVREVAVRSLVDAFGVYDEVEARQVGQVELRVRGIPTPIRLRKGTSDFDVFRQVFLCRQYALRVAEPVEYIVDAGANIGLSSIYLLRRFPQARVIAVEPDGENCALAAHNLQGYSDRCRLARGGVWSDDRLLGVCRGSYGDGRHWATQTVAMDERDAAGETAQAFTIQQLMDRFRFPRIDLLKMDIEGAELNVFRDGNLAFLERTACCVVECHDQAAKDAFLSAMDRFGFAVTRRGEVLVGSR
jgi:FkbM family methyltransferase